MEGYLWSDTPDTACLFKVLKYHTLYAKSVCLNKGLRGPSTSIQNWLDIPRTMFREATGTKAVNISRIVTTCIKKVQSELPLKTCLYQTQCCLHAVLVSEETGPKVEIHFSENYFGIYLYLFGKLAGMSLSRSFQKDYVFHTARIYCTQDYPDKLSFSRHEK